MSRFILQPSEKPGYWVCTDTVNKIVCVFRNKAFNEDQNVASLEDFNPINLMFLASLMKQMGDWLRENHYEKLF